jgi:hypothetical protein
MNKVDPEVSDESHQSEKFKLLEPSTQHINQNRIKSTSATQSFSLLALFLLRAERLRC